MSDKIYAGSDYTELTTLTGNEYVLVDDGANTKRVKLSTLYASAPLTGTPTSPTAASSTNTTQIATTAFVQTLTGDIETLLTAL